MQNIERKLESALGKKTDLDSRLKSASSSVLTQKIEFQESSKPHSSVTDMLKGKYVNLAPAAAPVQRSASDSNTSDDGEGLPQPKQILFTEPLDFSWSHQRTGIGFANSGNTCFLNATLQILIHCPPLTNYMMSGHHSSICRVNNYERCILCSLQFLTKKCLTFIGGNNQGLSPKWFTNNLQYIGRHFRCGRQEDAHEFLRLSLEKMQKCALIGYNGIDKYSKETTVINKIFGGYLRSQVICCRCGQKSNTYDPLLDVSLDIKSADNIERAFHQFVSPEKLENDNAYKCENCKQKVTAIKKFTIHRAPNVLTIQLKRFQFGSAGHFFGGGNKVHKPVRYPLHLNIRPFMSHRNGPPVAYTLFGSIQHEGMTCNSGHYVANVRCNNKWYHFNDSTKYQRNPQHCLNENSAYILFYLKDVPPTPQIGPSLKTQNDQRSVWGKRDEADKKQKLQTNGPSYATVVKSPPTVNVNQKSARPVGIPGHQPKFTAPTYEARNQKVAAQSSQKINSVPSNEVGKSVKSVKSPFVPLTSDRDKVKFSIGEKNKTKEAGKSPDKPKVSVKPEEPASSPKPISRVNSTSSIKSEGSVCLMVNHGKSFTIERSPDGGARIINEQKENANGKQSKKSAKKRRIVPYGSDSDSSSSSSPTRQASRTTESRQKENGYKKSGLVVDGALNATTSVPGNAHLYSTVTMKDKVSHTSSHHAGRPKDLKMFSPKHGQSSPLKRQFSETLTCDTNSALAKHSGTGEWHTSFESMQSPSIGSNHSSVHSSGSTHEWSVLKNKENVSNGTERKQDGWTVTPGRKDVEKTISKEDVGAVRVNQDSPSSPYEDISDRVLLIKPEKSKDKNSEEYRLYKKMKKHKKHKKRKHHEREHNYAEMSDDSIGRSHKKKKKKHKHREEEREDNRYKKYKRDEDVDREERHRDEEREENRHKKYKREEDVDEEDRHRDEEREENRHKKYKREEDVDKEERHRDRDERKHKKYEREQENRVERHRDRSEEERQQNRKYDRESEDGNRQKYKDDRDDRHYKGRHDREANETSHKRSRRESESSSEFEWVEKPAPVRASVSEPVTPSHRWDYHIKDSYKRVSSSGTSTPVVSRSWDGLKASKVAQELEKVSSYSYGAPVSGWDGSKSQLDIDKDREYVSRKRKDSDDEYDDEYDRGKVKKVKHKHQNEHRYNGNMFQQKQDNINRSKINWSTIKVGENNPFTTTQNQPDRPQHNPDTT